MVNYGNGKVYKIEPIVDHDEGDVYFGSTTKKYLSQRMDDHRSQYKSWQKGVGKKTRSFELFDKYGVDNCRIILLERVNANSKDELIAREAHHIKNNKCVNGLVPQRTVKEYYEDNKHTILPKHNIYKKQKILCCCGTFTTFGHKTRHEKTLRHLKHFEIINCCI